MGLLLATLVIVFACIVIARASDGFEAAADYLGRNLNEGIKGATINAIGSSLPELLTTFFFLVVLKDAEGFASGLGTTAGSAIFNGVIIPAAVILVVISSGVARKINISRKVVLRDGLSLLACELVLIFFITGAELKAIHGLLLMLLYAAYIAFMLLGRSKEVAEPAESEPQPEPSYIGSKKPSTLKYFLGLYWLDLASWFFKKVNNKSATVLLVASAIVMGLACHLLVTACVWLGSEEFSFLGSSFKGLGIPVYFLSVIVASAATSVPDTLLSMKDARKGNYDDAISNALGSNIFDICFALGFPLFMYTLVYGPIALNDGNGSGELRILLFIVTVLAFLIFVLAKSIRLVHALLLIALYLLFSTYIIGRALNWSFLVPLADKLNSLAAALGVLF